ncbi:PREDICTED: protein indeterminate-domain 1-like [Nelumbo nucifera]|uniref:Protein indeterminate-domain 1-like n=1 Tax=Nelumbo nucifera TaxID=4432 RepID=A0A1U8Q2K8_NELNU|nr:PREDICTED: protein indeterminate-domain 1-like [Nelumbo nucifera]
MPAELENTSAVTVSTASGEASASSSGNQTAPPSTTTKKKRNLPGMPDPDAEVIALSPKTLMATNRFVCEICNKGFQRDQNLQLHRRGHNLPWKLRQRSSKEVRKRVYVCPEPSCVHHDPSRALGDLTGIKKHFCRKHGEKKWKCDKCSKKYAVQSDWKAHSKTCGTREYRCDCGTLFSRRDSFITHRAFCDALAEESARAQTVANSNSEEDPKLQMVATAATSSPPPASSAPVISAGLPIQNPELPEVQENPSIILNHAPSATCLDGSSSSNSSSNGCGSSNNSSNVFASLFASSAAAGSLQPQTSSFSDLICAMARSERPTTLSAGSAAEPTSLCLSSTSLFAPVGAERRQFAPLPQPAMSATALLQKAAQMGAAGTNASLLRGLGLTMTSSSPSEQQESLQWSRRMEAEPAPLAAGLGLGLPCEGGTATGLTELMMGQSSLFGPRPTTLDLLGLGMGSGGAPTGGLSALITSIGGGLDVTAAAASFGGGGSSPGRTWEEASERKPNSPPALL